MTPTAAGSEPALARSLDDAPVSLQERSLPTQVSAAWELELLIAGAVTFALLQLPGRLEELRGWLASVIGGSRSGQMVSTLGAVYAKAVLYTLIVTFLINLTARAYWVGLVGLHSVFPRGARWEQMRMGPIFTETYRRQSPSLPAVIARVDNFASVIFSFGFLIVIAFVFSIAGLVLLNGVAWAIAQVLTGGRFVLAIAAVLGALLLAPGIVAGLVDKRRGDRLDPKWRRRLERVARVSVRYNGSAFFGPIFFTLTSNGGRNRTMALTNVAIIGALALSLGESIVRLGAVRIGAATFAPADPDLHGVHAEHYESLMPPRVGDRNVIIQSDVVEGPYVRLFVPFRDQRHALALRGCRPAPGPRGAAGASDGATADAARVLACFTELHAVTLDGVRVQQPDFRFYTHPASGVGGLVAYLPTAGLAPGLHTIVVQPPPQTPDRRDRPNPPTEIPFWR